MGKHAHTGTLFSLSRETLQWVKAAHHQQQGFLQHPAEDEVLSPSPDRSEARLFMKHNAPSTLPPSVGISPAHLVPWGPSISLFPTCTGFFGWLCWANAKEVGEGTFWPPLNGVAGICAYIRTHKFSLGFSLWQLRDTQGKNVAGVSTGTEAWVVSVREQRQAQGRVGILTKQRIQIQTQIVKLQPQKTHHSECQSMNYLSWSHWMYKLRTLTSELWGSNRCPKVQ